MTHRALWLSDKQRLYNKQRLCSGRATFPPLPPLTPNCMNITMFLAGVSHEQECWYYQDQWLFQQRSKNNLFSASKEPCCSLGIRRKFLLLTRVQKVSPILGFSINLGEWKKKVFYFKEHLLPNQVLDTAIEKVLNLYTVQLLHMLVPWM